MTLNPQLEFDFAFRHGRPFLYVEELVHELDCSRDFILGHVDDGTIVANDFKLKKLGEVRCLRIFRPSILHLLVSRKLQSQFQQIAKKFKCDFSSALPHSRPLLSPRDCWQTMNVTKEHIYNLIEYKRLPKIPCKREEATRQYTKIERSIFLKFLEETKIS